MKSLTAFLALAVTPAFAHDPGHAHVHSIDLIPITAGALAGAAAICGWLALRAIQGRR